MQQQRENKALPDGTEGECAIRLEETITYLVVLPCGYAFYFAYVCWMVMMVRWKNVLLFDLTNDYSHSCMSYLYSQTYKTEAYPDTALKLCDKKKLPLDEQLEAAVAIVKRAYNEVPSYELSSGPPYRAATGNSQNM